MIEKLDYLSLVARGGLRMLSEKSMAFFGETEDILLGEIYSKYVDEDGEKTLEFNEEYLSQRGISVQKYSNETFLNFGSSGEYVILKNQKNEILVYFLEEDNIYFVDEIFDDYQVIYNGYWDLGYSILDKDFVFHKGNERYFLHENEIIFCGEEIVANAFYDEASRSLHLLEWGLTSYHDVQNLKMYNAKYDTLEFESAGKRFKKIYKNGEWNTPIFWKIFERRR